jgi:hypothetical protein
MTVFSNSTTMSNMLEMALEDMVIPAPHDGFQQFNHQSMGTGDGVGRYGDLSTA